MELVPKLLVLLNGWLRKIGAPTVVSTNQPEAFKYPPAAKPRARMMALAGIANPANCQPPGARSPAPRAVQSFPLVEASKVARQTSGVAPPRSQVMVEPSEARLCVAASVLLSRPIMFRVCPARFVKVPPTKIFPSACNAREYT